MALDFNSHDLFLILGLARFMILSFNFLLSYLYTVILPYNMQ